MGHIVVVTDAPPSISFPSGYSARLFHLLRALARRHRVSLLALTSHGTVEAFSNEDLDFLDVSQVPIGPNPLVAHSLRGRILRCLHYVRDKTPFMSYPKTLPALQNLLSANRADLVLFYLPNLCHLCLDIPAVPPSVCLVEEDWLRSTSRDVIGLSSVKQRLANVTEERRIRRLYAAVGLRATGIAVLSEYEREWLASFMPFEKIDVFPHSIDCSYFSPAGPGQVSMKWDVLVVGNFEQPRNGRGVVELARAMRRLEPARLASWRWAFVGKGSCPLVKSTFGSPPMPGTFFATGYVDDIRPFYNDTRLVLVPDAEGTGVKTTVLQGWAMERPVVATEAATRGLPIELGVNILTSPSADGLLEQLASLLSDDELAQSIGRMGRRTVIESRDIRRVAEDFLSYCTSMMPPGS